MRTKTITAILAVLLLGVSVQVGVLVDKLNKRDAQVGRMVAAMEQMIQVEKKLYDELKELKQRLATAEKRIQRLDMVASWYGPGFHGRTTASGQVYDQMAYTCAHKTLPFGTVLVVEYRGKRITAVVNDRGPFIAGRELDLSRGCADALGFTRKGVDKVTVYKVEV